MLSADVVVAGVGAAGLLIASALAPAWSVLLVEQSDNLPRNKYWLTSEGVLQGLTTQEVALYKARFQGAGQPLSPPSGAALGFRPPCTAPQWSTLQVQRIEWARAPRFRTDTDGNQNLHVVVGCQRRFPTGLDTRQRYGLVINFWHAGEKVRMYQELRAVIRQPVRVRVQP